MKNFHLHNLSSKFLGKIPLRIIFTVPFLIELFIIVGLVGVLSYRSGEEGVNDVASQLRSETANRIKDNLDTFTKTPDLIAEITQADIRQGKLNLDNPKAIEKHLWQQLSLFQYLTFNSYGNEKDEYIGANRDFTNGTLRISISNSKNNNINHNYNTDNKGNRTEVYQVNTKFYPRQRGWYKQAKYMGKKTWYPIYKYVAYESLGVGISVPIYRNNVDFEGAIGVDMALVQISNFLHTLKIGRTGQAFIMEYDGNLVANSNLEQPYVLENGNKISRLLATHSKTPLVQETANYLKTQFTDFANIKKEQELSFLLEGKRQFIKVLPFEDGRGLSWLIVVIIPEADFMEHIYANTQQTIFLCFMAFFLVIILGIFTANWVTKPILILKKAAKHIAEGNLHQSVEINQTYELVELANSFNKMADRLEESFENLEDKVKQRTVELAEANQEIVALNQLLKADNIRMSTELEITKQLQQMVLPKPAELASITDLDISGFMQTADEVGGDYYDVLVSDGQVTIGIGDVTGHGLESGLLMLMTQAAATTLQASQETDHIKFLNVVNRAIYRNTQRINSEKTLSLSFLNYRDGLLTITGQHEQVIIVRNDGEVEQIDTDALGFPIGLEAEINDFIATEQVLLNKGDVVVLYTDGITEAENMEKQQYGLERLIEVVKENSPKSATEIQEEVIENLREFIGKQKVFDDITLVVLKRK